jgi:hypothetical protein
LHATITVPSPLARAAAWARATRWHAPALSFAIPFLLLAIGEGLAFSPWGSDWLFLVDIALYGLAALALLAAVALLLLAALAPGRRSSAWPRIALLLMFVAGTVAGAQASKPIRENGWHRLAERGDRIVLALHAYEARHGRPPATLAALSPEFMTRLPGTGLGSRPDFRYAVRHGEAGHETWSLWTGLPGIGHISDFEYLPTDDVQAWDTVLHRVGAWAVVAND